MKSFLIVLIACLFFQNSFSQDNRVHSQKQVQEQMKQAKTQAQQLIIDKENEIAEAQKNNVDPNEIEEMKKNLATLKKMLGVIDNAANENRNKRPETIETSNTVAPYKSPYVKFYTQPVVIPTEAQAKDRLLWYRGKKINKNTLITTNGRVIQYDRQNNQVLVQYNEKKDTNTLKIISNLKKSRQWTNNYVNNEAGKKNSFFDYPLVMMTMQEFNLIEQEFNKLADNSIQLPGPNNLMTMVMPVQTKTGSGPFYKGEFNSADSFDLDEWARQMQQKLRSLINNAPPLDFPAPPKHEFDLCYYCDTSLQSKFYRKKNEWDEKFTEFEAKLLSACFTIQRQYSLLLGSDVDIGESGVPGLQADIDSAKQLVDERMEKKLNSLLKQYGKDVYRLETIVSNLFGWARQMALLGFDDHAASKSLAWQQKAIELFEENYFEQFIDQRIQANDYNVVFNYSILLGHQRQKELLGASNGEDWDEELQKVEKLNRFALALNIDFDIQYEPDEGKPNLKANGHLSTTEKIYVRLGRTEDCKWQLYKYDPDYGSTLTRDQETLFKIPMTVNSGTKQVLKDDHWVSYPYTGPKDLEMNFPSFRISFCPNSGSDSAMMDIIRYKQENVSGDVTKAYTADLLGYLDKVLVSISDTKANQNEVVDIIGQMSTLPNQATVDNPTGYAKLDKMQVDYKLNGIQHDLQKKTTETTRANNTVILFDAQNGDQFLINAKTNTAHRELNVIKLNNGLIQLKVVLEPL